MNEYMYDMCCQYLNDNEFDDYMIKYRKDHKRNVTTKNNYNLYGEEGERTSEEGLSNYRY